MVHEVVMARERPRSLMQELAMRFPELDDPADAIQSGHVLVNGIPITNRASMVKPGSSVAVRPARPLRGALKLQAGLDAFQVRLEGRSALDLGASSGGFTSALLARGASRVYAVDAGHGQLLGSLRQDPRVVNLEATNLADLDARLVPEPVDIVTVDLSFVSLARALPQIDGAILAAGAELVALVKPMFELGLPQPPESPEQLDEAVRRAVAGIESAGWRVLASMRSALLGARGAVEFFVHAVRDR
jgi:23S rRNA (cytidine1920-2'-O)/16S rRNA (cytidine1409-2'-O)-methyltransferase